MLTMVTSHAWEHYGNLVTYMRLNGMRAARRADGRTREHGVIRYNYRTTRAEGWPSG